MKITKEILKTSWNYFKRNKTVSTLIISFILFMVTPFSCDYKEYHLSKGGIKYLSTDTPSGGGE